MSDEVSQSQIDYGSRVSIGLLLPSSNIVTENELQCIFPLDVAYRTTRLKLVSSDEQALLAMIDSVESGANLLADANVKLIVFHCTSATTYKFGVDDEIVQRVEKATGIPATCTSHAVLHALKTLQVKKLAVSTPYVEETNRREVAFLERHGIEVVDALGLNCRTGQEMFAITPEEWCRQVLKQGNFDADAYFISCCTIRATPIISQLEEKLDRPVITSNQVMAWHALRLLRIEDKIKNYGKLFSNY